MQSTNHYATAQVAYLVGKLFKISWYACTWTMLLLSSMYLKTDSLIIHYYGLEKTDGFTHTHKSMFRQVKTADVTFCSHVF